jgi:hypothetical protein
MLLRSRLESPLISHRRRHTTHLRHLAVVKAHIADAHPHVGNSGQAQVIEISWLHT